MDSYLIAGIFVVLLTLILNALISCAESSLKYVNESNARKRAELGDKKAIRLVRLLDAPKRYINVIDTIPAFTAFVIGMTCITGDLINISIWIKVLLTILLMYLILLFGIILPRKLGARRAETFAYSLSGVIVFFSWLFLPFCFLLEKSTVFLLRIFGANVLEPDDNVTQEEIKLILNEGQEQGVLEADEAEMMTNIIEFDEKTARDIMTNRKKMVSVDADLTMEAALDFMLVENYSRFPMYQDELDNIIGVLHIKEVMKYSRDPASKLKLVREAAREPYFVPDTQTIDSLFRGMQKKKIHMAIAIDEYGQTAGLISMEDIIEEILGDIQDEYDEEEEAVVMVEPDLFMVRGDASLEEVADATGLSLDEEILDEFITLNGLMISLLDRIPADGETAKIEHAGFSFEVLDTRHRMIKSVRMSKLKDVDIGNEEDDFKILGSKASGEAKKDSSVLI